jgi:hypothetical protein
VCNGIFSTEVSDEVERRIKHTTLVRKKKHKIKTHTALSTEIGAGKHSPHTSRIRRSA